ncbi:MAG: tyrosine protein kinase, partial [Lachnospiraceae bacterium]|nr:tyrosine protein kinase [Lachnospiraceae bacterium]
MNDQMLELQFSDTEDFAFNEAIKTLRTNLQFSGSRLKKILITSVAPNDGKSVISMMLARAFA